MSLLSEAVLTDFDADQAVCIGCGADEVELVEDGRTWLAVDWVLGLGVCSACPERLDEFQ